MNEYKFQLRRKKRGDYCLIDKCRYDGDYSRERSRNGLCGCGVRCPPPKEEKTKIVRRKLKQLLEEELKNES